MFAHVKGSGGKRFPLDVAVQEENKGPVVPVTFSLSQRVERLQSKAMRAHGQMGGFNRIACPQGSA